jgi:hypothetical protein
MDIIDHFHALNRMQPEDVFASNETSSYLIVHIVILFTEEGLFGFNIQNTPCSVVGRHIKHRHTLHEEGLISCMILDTFRHVRFLDFSHSCNLSCDLSCDLSYDLS